MDNRTPIQPAKWLEFDSGTFFGKDHIHFGIILGIDLDNSSAVILINATHQVEKCRQFQKRYNFPADTIVETKAYNDESGRTFTQDTAFNCNRVKRVPLSEIEIYSKQNKVRLASYNEDVNPVFLQKLVKGVDDSPMVPKYIKSIVHNTNNL